MLFFRILDVQIHVFFWSNKTAYRISFFCFPGSSEKSDMRSIDPCTSRLQRGGSTIWATSLVRKRGTNAISDLSSVNAIAERSSFAYRSKFGFVDAGYQSMCFSHANRLPFRLTYLAGGVQRSCLCQTDVFDSLISIVMFPPASFWGKPWWFGTPITFSASSVLFWMLFFRILDVQIHVFFWSNKTAYRFSLFGFPGSSEKWEMRGHRFLYLSIAKRGLYHLIYIPSEETGS